MQTSKNAFILIWNSKRQNYSLSEITDSNQPRWSCGNTKKIKRGDRLYFYRVGEYQGLIGAGKAKRFYQDESWDDFGKRSFANYVDIDWDQALLNIPNRLMRESLEKACPALPWNRMQASGFEVPPQYRLSLEKTWQQHLAVVAKKHGLTTEIVNKQAKALSNTITYPNEIETTKKYFEGALISVQVDRYERNLTARKACLNEYGSVCSVCDFDFKKFYGPTGKGIHVHHTTELSTIGKEYELDPLEDLCPVCPNCHAMLHSTRPAMSIDELMYLIETQKKKHRRLVKLRK